MDDSLVKDNPHWWRQRWSHPLLPLLSGSLQPPRHKVPEERRPRTENCLVARQLDGAGLTSSLLLPASEDKNTVGVLPGQVQVLQVSLQQVWHPALPAQ